MDPIADMLTQIRNALLVGHKTCLVRHSKIKEAILVILKERRYINDFKVEEKNGLRNIRVFLAYDINNKPVIKNIRRISKCGRRIYFKKDDLPYILNGIGMMIISTSNGLMTDHTARKNGFGGEAICEVW